MSETTIASDPNIKVEAQEIKIVDKWLIWILDAYENIEKRPGFKLLRIEPAKDDRPSGGDLISLYFYEETPEATALVKAWIKGEAIPIPDVHWLENSERNFKRVVRHNRNQT